MARLGHRWGFVGLVCHIHRVRGGRRGDGGSIRVMHVHYLRLHADVDVCVYIYIYIYTPVGFILNRRGWDYFMHVHDLCLHVDIYTQVGLSILNRRGWDSANG